MQENLNSITNTNYSNLYYKEEKLVNNMANNGAQTIIPNKNKKKTVDPDIIMKKIMIMNFDDHEVNLIEQSLNHLKSFNYTFQFKISDFSESVFQETENSRKIAIVFYKGNISDPHFKETVSVLREKLINAQTQIILMNDNENENADTDFLINNKVSYCLSKSDLKEQKLKVITASALRSFRLQKENTEYDSDISKVVTKRTKDLSEKNEELLKADATKNKMFSIIAHDLVNPFNSILGFSKMLKDQFSDFNKERIELFADQIYETSQNTYKLLANLLEWSRAQTGKIKYSPRKVSVKSLIKNTITLHRSLAEKKGLYLKYNEKNDFYVYCDPNMISTIMRNLVSNGIKFTEKGGVTINAEKEGEFCTICFTDTGCGIQHDRIENLFTFENLSTKGTAGERGTGLGLLLCNEFAVRNNGSITVESKVNSGSTFCVKIPLFPS